MMRIGHGVRGGQRLREERYMLVTVLDMETELFMENVDGEEGHG